ncbi:hypothetical protein M2387_001125 [Klebsiella sp. BIGb0407]|nr:hypothetical protein [Klebsiella sp. BIGb0407]
MKLSLRKKGDNVLCIGANYMDEPAIEQLIGLVDTTSA